MKLIRSGLVAPLLLTFSALSYGAELNQAAVDEFIEEVAAEHGFSRAALVEVFKTAKRSDRVIKAMSRPAEKAKPWYEYRKHFIKPARINAGVKFWRQHVNALDLAFDAYGVPPEIIVAIIGVETSYGSFTGRDRVLDALATLAFHYPKNRSNRDARMRFFRAQLKELLLLARQQQIDPASLTGSYAGAMGIPQFMPESYRKYAIDFNQDGASDIWNDEVDAIGSVANYLKVNGGWLRDGKIVVAASVGTNDVSEILSDNAKPDRSALDLRARGIDVGEIPDDELVALFSLEGKGHTEYWLALQNFRAIMKYNPRTKYAMAVYQLAAEIARARESAG